MLWSVFLIIVSASPAFSQTEERATYRIVTSKGEDLKAQTGFRLQGYDGVITALHGVANGRKITIDGNQVGIVAVDLANDLALLSGSDLPRNRRNDVLTLSPKVLSTRDWSSLKAASVIGYPLKLDRGSLRLTVFFAKGGTQPLAQVLNSEIREKLRPRRSPSLATRVVVLTGPLHPGHSGAPILDENGDVLAVANGGFPRAGVGWAIPIDQIRFSPLTSAIQRALLEMPTAGVFAYSTDADDEDFDRFVQKQLSDIKKTSEGIKKDTDEILDRLDSGLTIAVGGGTANGRPAFRYAVGIRIGPRAINGNQANSLYFEYIRSTNRFQKERIVYGGGWEHRVYFPNTASKRRRGEGIYVGIGLGYFIGRDTIDDYSWEESETWGQRVCIGQDSGRLMFQIFGNLYNTPLSSNPGKQTTKFYGFALGWKF
jgi:S1-C subfamily serine protease